MKPRVASLFSGVGTFDHGFHLAGWETVYLCEWDPKARQVLAARFPDVPLTTDVREVRGADLPDAECIMFGSPCQDISVAGKRGGMIEGSDTRSSLFFEAVRIIREKWEATGGQFPRFALWENVVGAFSSNGGRDFAAVLSAMVGGTVHVPAGRWRNAGVAFGAFGQGAWRVLDSQFFGVPQRRRRIFLVVDFGGECAGQILLESEGVRGHPRSRRKAGQGITGCLTGGTGSSSAGNPDDNRAQAGFLVPISGEALDKCLTTGTGRRYDAETETLIPIAFDCQTSYPQGSVGDTPTLLAGTQADGGRGRVACAIPIQDGQHGVKSQNGLGIGESGDVAYTLDTKGAQSVATYVADNQGDRIYVNPDKSATLSASGGGMGAKTGLYAMHPTYAVRRLTPVECERLQSMPDGWTDVDGMADSHRYRFMGNGGTAWKLRWIARRMKAVL